MFSCRVAVFFIRICFFVRVFPVAFSYSCLANSIAICSHFSDGRLASVMATWIVLLFIGSILMVSFVTPASLVSSSEILVLKIGMLMLKSGAVV